MEVIADHCALVIGRGAVLVSARNASEHELILQSLRVSTINPEANRWPILRVLDPVLDNIADETIRSHHGGRLAFVILASNDLHAAHVGMRRRECAERSEVAFCD